MLELSRWARFSALLLILGWTRPQAQGILTLNAHLYDHDYGEFNDEFDETGVWKCAYDSHKYAPGMVQDTLSFDPVKGKKIPHRGNVNVCSDSLEKWFDPSLAKAAACGNIFLQNVGTASVPVWKFQDNQFFPVDSISRQTHWTKAGGGRLDNDYAYCMEINAGMVYHGGETMKFNGDDDLWVYLDNRLAVDQGGIHYAMESVTRLDSLPFLAGKQGRNLDLDIYFCSRQPGTAVFGMETNIDLKPLPVKSLQIVDTAGKQLDAQDIVVGKTRLCARALFQLPGEEVCGNYKIPKGLTFLAADWDLNGQTLSQDGGSDCLDLDPADFADNTRLNLTAKAAAKTSRISLTLLRVAHPRAGILQGDGRAESVVLDLDSASGPVRDGLQVRFNVAGKPVSAFVYPQTVSAAGGGAQTLSGPVDDLGAPAWGLTGFTGLAATTRQYLFGHQVNSAVELRDGVRPVLTEAKFHWGTPGSYPAYLEVLVSEPLSAPAPTAALFQAKRSDNEALNLDATAESCPASAPGCFRLALSEAMVAALVSGDSLSLSALAADSAGNTARPHFVSLEIPVNLGGTAGQLRFLENPVVGAPFVATAAAGLIPVSPSKIPLLDRESDRTLAEAHGPVLMVPTTVPLLRIRLRFHDHLGGFVNSAEREFTLDDWDRIKAASPGDTTWVRLMWYPVSRIGGKLGTGAYIVEGEMFSRDGAMVPGQGGEIVRVRGASYRLDPKLFGYIRD